MTEMFRIIEHYQVLRVADNGWTRELNLVSWYGKEPMYDVRWWSPDKRKAGKGVSLSHEEMSCLSCIHLQEEGALSG